MDKALHCLGLLHTDSIGIQAVFITKQISLCCRQGNVVEMGLAGLINVQKFLKVMLETSELSLGINVPVLKLYSSRKEAGLIKKQTLITNDEGICYCLDTCSS